MQPIVVSCIYFILALFFQARSIYGGDSGDLVTAAVTGGVPHPSGYPLYTLLGGLANFLPIATPSWRVTILSSLFHAATLFMVYKFTFLVSKKHITSLFAVCLLGANYLFTLYTLTPEVFGMLNFFTILLFYLLYQLTQTRKPHYLVWLGVAGGLSLSHHPLVLFLAPSVLYGIFVAKPRDLTFPLQAWIRACVGFCLGLAPYLYIVWAARGSSPINWNHAVNLPQFLRLVSRADYGTFVSGAPQEIGMAQRFLNLQAYVDFFLLDFSWVGAVGLVLGIVWLWRINRRLLALWGLAVAALGPGFFFYASFPLANRFALGTYERFMLPSYVLIAPIIAYGVMETVRFFIIRIGSVRSKTKPIFVLFVSLGLFLYPLLIGGITGWRFVGLAQDKTVQYLSEDILASAPPNALVFLVHDVSLFGTQYVRYGLGVRPDTEVIHVARLILPDYQQVLQGRIPTIVIPEESPTFLADFIVQNAAIRPVVSNSILPLPDTYEWVPRGLVYEAVEKKVKPTDAQLLETNTQLWQQFHDPRVGILGRYHHLMLANVLDEYAASAIRWGDVLVGAEEVERAKSMFEKAATFDSDSERANAYTKLGVTQAILGECTNALASLDMAQSLEDYPNVEIYNYKAIIYRDCLHDDAGAAVLFSEYEQRRLDTQTKLEHL